MQLTTTFHLLHLFTLVCFANAGIIPLKAVRLSHLIKRDTIVQDPELVTATVTVTVAPTLTATPATTIILDQFPTPTNSPIAPSTPEVGPRKYVVAHHMVGNTFPYKSQDWSEDIRLAHGAGIDGFALNMGIDEWQPARVADAYEAAKQTGLDFKLFLSLDMASFPCGSPQDAQRLRGIVNKFVNHPNQLLTEDGKAFVSTFAGEECTFGQGSAPEGWRTQFTQHADLAGKISFVPAFFVGPTKFKEFSGVMDGDFNWNSAWPVQVTKDFANKALDEFNKNPPLLNVLDKAKPIIVGGAKVELAIEDTLLPALSKTQLALSKFIGSNETDKEHLDALGTLHEATQDRRRDSSKPLYMGSVSPWFFTHYGADSFNKNFVYLSDQHLYSKRWESLVANRDQYDIVQVLTWNDYGESHYIGPIKGDQPNSEAWTDGMDHTAWLELTKYYANAFKTGAFPKIEKDQIIMWSRPHSVKSSAPDPIPQPTNFELFDDTVWAVVMATQPAVVTLSVSETSSQSFNVPEGLSKLAVPITPGGFMKGTIRRNDQTVVELNPKNFRFEGSPSRYNFNAFVTGAGAV